MAARGKDGKVRTLTLGLLKAGATSLKALEAALEKWDQHEISIGKARVGVLYLRPSYAAPVRWAELFDEADENPAAKRQQRFQSGVFLAEAGGRRFVIPVGHGHHAVPDEALEPNFGRNVSLNVLDPQALRLVDNVRFDGTSRASRTQIARPSQLNDFGFEPLLDLVRSVSGACSDPSFAKRVSGTTYFQATRPIKLSGLHAFLLECLANFRRTDYRQTFPEIDRMRDVRDPSIQARLDKALVDLVNGAPGIVWLAVPDFVDWSGFDSFSYGHTRTAVSRREDLFVGDLRAALGSDATLAMVKRARVIMHMADGTEHPWSAYKCLYAEIDLGTGDRRYVLHDGHWYEIDRDLVTEVKDFVSKLAAPAITIPSWPMGTGEQHFNELLTKANAAAVLLDRRLVRLRGATAIEVCDVFGPGNELVHVKRYSGSQVLSHLFGQGVAAAEALTDPQFRAAASAGLGIPLFAHPSWSTERHSVTYLIGSHSKKPLDLPFFSLITLRAAARRLESLRYRVALGKVLIA